MNVNIIVKVKPGTDSQTNPIRHIAAQMRGDKNHQTCIYLNGEPIAYWDRWGFKPIDGKIESVEIDIEKMTN